MGWKKRAIGPFAKLISKRIERTAANAISDQDKWRSQLIQQAIKTRFGKEHGFAQIKNYQDFQKQIPIRDYEAFKDYIVLMREGNPDILWKGHPKYWAKTSGTTSGAKYIPISKESLPNHMNTARNALLSFAYRNGLMDIFDGKLIFMSGSPKLDNSTKVPTGRLSGIVNYEIPNWAKGNQVPTFQTNCIEDWESKIDAIADEALETDLRLISGIPPWVQMFYERLLEKSGKETILEIFPNYKIFAYGGVNFEPYKTSLEQLVGGQIPSFETYPASEGFIGFQDRYNEKGLLLNTNSGIYYEFVPVAEIHNPEAQRLSLREVELDQDYAVIINNNAGLWGYNLGDTIRFISKSPFRIVVSGRVKHYTSAFGEHVIAKEVEQAFSLAAEKFHGSSVEFTIAPQVNPKDKQLPYHEWFIEFNKEPEDLTAFAKCVDVELRKQNIYYDDLIKGKILQALVVRKLKKGAFQSYMKSIGKLGGQNKVPRLSNDRKIADQLNAYVY